MVYTDEDSVVIEFLCQNKGHGARRLVKEFPSKKEIIGNINRLNFKKKNKKYWNN